MIDISINDRNRHSYFCQPLSDLSRVLLTSLDCALNRFANLCSLATDLCHTWTHGKQGQRQEGNQESSEAQAETGTRAQTRSVYASPAKIIRKEPPATPVSGFVRCGEFGCSGSGKSEGWVPAADLTVAGRRRTR